jgi:hypothetical protein
VTFGLRALFAVADGFDLRGLRTHQFELLRDDLRALVAECEVVLTRTALVGVAFDADLHLRVRLQELAVRLHQGLVFGIDSEVVVREEHAARGEVALRVVERIERDGRDRALRGRRARVGGRRELRGLDRRLRRLERRAAAGRERGRGDEGDGEGLDHEVTPEVTNGE